MKYRIASEQKQEIEDAQRKNQDKRIAKRLMVLALRADGPGLKEIANITGYSRSYVSKLVASYSKKGIAAVIENHYTGNRRNMSIEEEAALLETFREKAEQGQIIEVREIKAAYEKTVGLLLVGAKYTMFSADTDGEKSHPETGIPIRLVDEIR